MLTFLLGLGLLLVGAHFLVKGASSMARRMGLSPLVVGLTVVAYGTSAPELAINLKSAMLGVPDVGVGNIVGANISNLLLILGATALMAPIVVRRRLLRMDVPLMIGFALCFLMFAVDGNLSAGDGVVLFIGLVFYTVLALKIAKSDPCPDPDEKDETLPGWGSALLCFAGGLVLLVLGSDWLVESAVALARGMGVSELVIGLTVVALGTTMPELITSIVASLKGQRDMALGNVIGSFVCNILGILGLSAMLSEGGLPVPPAVIRFDLPFMVVVAIACLPIFFIGSRISRWEGGFFLFYYLAYVLYVVLDAKSHDALPAFSGVLFGFITPMLGITVLVIAYREWRLMKHHHEHP
jgi:cation:H+ antiporter